MAVEIGAEAPQIDAAHERRAPPPRKSAAESPSEITSDGTRLARWVSATSCGTNEKGDNIGGS